jgi:Domain of unknown function (DUF4041)/T5orf172 domain
MSFSLPAGKPLRFNPPPNWPAPPPGWIPPPGWTPDPSWPPPPPGWQLWVEDPAGQPDLRVWGGSRWNAHAAPVAPVPAPPASGSSGPGTWGSDPQAKVPGRKRDLQAEVGRLRNVVDSMGVREQEELQAEIGRLRAELPQLRAEHHKLIASVSSLREETGRLAEQRLHMLTVQSEVAQLESRRALLAAAVSEAERLTTQLETLRAEHAELSVGLVETRETLILQEAGIYEYRHPLDDAVAYKARLAGVQARIKDAVKAGAAVRGSTKWTVNNSAQQGTKMVREFSKLMLRAYNNEADNAVRLMKPYTLESSVARLEKARETISKLGATMSIQVTDSYHRLRVEELELTADYLAKAAEEKERAREERARLREEEIVRREYEREQERLRKELAHYDAAIAVLREKGDTQGAERAQAKVAEIQDAIDGISRRAANIRAGHVYVISNVGAFGENMVKIGMTRRQNPYDRIRELGDASVPFLYDVHALVLSDDAVGLETRLHHEFADRRVNLVNLRREFFRVTPAEVRDVLIRHQGSIIEWVDVPEAAEWRQSETTRRQLVAKTNGVFPAASGASK